jgi:hypothetical protein
MRAAPKKNDGNRDGKESPTRIYAPAAGRNGNLGWQIAIDAKLKQLQQFGIICLANFSFWQLPKCYGKGKKRQSPTISHNSLGKIIFGSTLLIFSYNPFPSRAKMTAG